MSKVVLEVVAGDILRDLGYLNLKGIDPVHVVMPHLKEVQQDAVAELYAAGEAFMAALTEQDNEPEKEDGSFNQALFHKVLEARVGLRDALLNFKKGDSHGRQTPDPASGTGRRPRQRKKGTSPKSGKARR